MSTAACIIIGDEILSGKVRDTNAPILVDMLHDLGVSLKRITVIGDDLDEIAEEVRLCASRHDVVITSGGIGPTHDDRTVEGVARAFSVPVVRDSEVEQMIRAFWSGRLTEAALRMADKPEGGRLVFGDDGLLPTVAYANVYLLPGIPKLFAAKLPSLRSLLTGERTVLHSVYLRCDESRVAETLAAVDDDFAGVKVGSYPTLDHPEYRIWVTLEGTDGDAVDAATDRLLELLPADQVAQVQR